MGQDGTVLEHLHMHTPERRGPVERTEPGVEPHLTADGSALRVRLDGEPGTLDVLFDGHRVWSFDPLDHDQDDDGWHVVPWPASLAVRLDGTAEVAVRDHLDDVVLASAHCQFGASSRPVDLTDKHGRLLSLSKWGRLNQSLADLDREAVDWYLDRTEEVLTVLTDELGLPAFLSYGSLLGAMRSGRFIGHDMDVDLGYLSRARTPVDAMRESFAVERHLRRRGWSLLRQSGGFLQIFFRQPDGGSRNVDVFTLWADPVEERVYEINDISCPGREEDVVPLSSVTLEGRPLPAPRHPETLLVAAYGPSWRVPDPNFSYGMNPNKRQMREWFGGLREDRDTWNRFYRHQPTLPPSGPTSFAHWAVDLLDGVDAVVDLGSGLGRDTQHYARVSPRAIGVDVSTVALRRASRRARRRGIPAEFRRMNIGSMRDVLVVGAQIARSTPGRRGVVASHLLDAVGDAGYENVWRLCRTLASDGGVCLLQFGVPPGAPTFHDYPGLRARRLDPTVVVESAEAAGGSVEMTEQVTGPEGQSCRMVVRWP
jgi:SAM-dependent methyltransferase